MFGKSFLDLWSRATADAKDAVALLANRVSHTANDASRAASKVMVSGARSFIAAKEKVLSRASDAVVEWKQAVEKKASMVAQNGRAAASTAKKFIVDEVLGKRRVGSAINACPLAEKKTF